MISPVPGGLSLFLTSQEISIKVPTTTAWVLNYTAGLATQLVSGSFDCGRVGHELFRIEPVRLHRFSSAVHLLQAYLPVGHSLNLVYRLTPVFFCTC